MTENEAILREVFRLWQTQVFDRALAEMSKGFTAHLRHKPFNVNILKTEIKNVNDRIKNLYPKIRAYREYLIESLGKQ